MLMKAVMPKKFQLNVIPDFRTFLFPDGEIHYIGGSDILPAPLEADDEARAIGYLGSAHDEEARKLLIEHNLRLVVYIAKNLIILVSGGRSYFHRNNWIDQGN